MVVRFFLIYLLSIGSLSFADQLKIVTSFSILEDITQNIGKEHIQLTSIIKANRSAHGYEPTPSDIKLLSRADVFIINGLMFEGWLTRVINAANFKGIVVVASKGVISITGHEEHDHEHEEHDHNNGESIDPHIWQNPLNVITMAQNIEQALSQKDPKNKEQYQNNLEQYRQELVALDLWIQKALQNISKDPLNVLVLHDSFRYFTERYPIRFFSILGINTMSEPSAKEIAQLKETISDHKISAVFSETIEQNRFVNILVKDYGVKNGGALLSDALTNDKDQGDSYISMMRNNVELIIKAFDQ